MSERNTRVLTTALAVAASLLAGRAQAITVEVDCTTGGSINAILASAPPEPLVIQVHGMCAENVILERWDVTLRGVDPATDGIAPGSGIAVLVRNASMATIDRLGIRNGSTGIIVTDRALLVMKNSVLTQNLWGMTVRVLGYAVITDSLLQGNHTGGLQVDNGTAQCRRCTIKDNLDLGGLTTNVSVRDGYVTFNDSVISGTGWGLELIADASASLTGTSLSATSWAARLTDARAVLFGGTVDGPFRVDASRLNLRGVTQTAGASSNQVLNGSFTRFEKRGIATNIPRTTSFEGFSNGVATGTTFGHLTCASGADLWCDATVAMSSSSCRLCPRP